MRSSPIKKDKGKEKQPPAEPPPPAEEDPEVRPAIVCVQDKRASIQGANLINQQGIFRKIVKPNGRLSNTIYEDFFQILDDKMGKLTWTTVSGKHQVSEHKWAALKKWTILYDYLDDEEEHPPVWWTRNHYPIKEGGARNQLKRIKRMR
jgi:hypothetical protein